jgi:hypothetical protein
VRTDFYQYFVSDCSDSRHFLRGGFVGAKKIDRQERNSVSPVVVPQNIEITHDLTADVDRVADCAQRIINLKN